MAIFFVLTFDVSISVCIFECLLLRLRHACSFLGEIFPFTRVISGHILQSLLLIRDGSGWDTSNLSRSRMPKISVGFNLVMTPQHSRIAARLPWLYTPHFKTYFDWYFTFTRFISRMDSLSSIYGLQYVIVSLVLGWDPCICCLPATGTDVQLLVQIHVPIQYFFICSICLTFWWHSQTTVLSVRSLMQEHATIFVSPILPFRLFGEGRGKQKDGTYLNK